MSALLESLAESFRDDASPVGAVRRAALDAALRDGLPHSRTETWKYTPLRALERRSFSAPVQVLQDHSTALPDGPRLVFVNGILDASRSTLDLLPDGVSLRPLSSSIASGGDEVTSLLGGGFDRADEVFARLNTAFAAEGAVLHVQPGIRVGMPLHLVFIGAPSDADHAWHLRNAISLGEGASLGLVEHQLGAGTHQHLANALTRIELAPGASLQHVRLQSEAEGATLFSRTDAVLAADATYRRLDLELGAALSRHELNVALQGERAALQANGVLVATGRRHLDTRLGIDHAARDTACELVWRGLGAGRSRAVFHGGILIREGADGTSAALSNKNLLLSADAEIDTQPVLEIHADEVQAAHGATVGQLDPTALFYLRSRGVPQAQARALLTAAFCRETLQVLEDARLREAATSALDATLDRLVSA